MTSRYASLSHPLRAGGRHETGRIDGDGRSSSRRAPCRAAGRLEPSDSKPLNASVWPVARQDHPRYVLSR